MSLKVLIEEKELWLVDGDIYDLIDIRELRKISRIDKIHIKNVKDFGWIKKVLGHLSIEKIEGIIIQECNLEEFDISIFERMQSIQKISLIKSNGLDYNAILNRIPNINQLEKITFWDNESGNNKINLEALKVVKNLRGISLRNIEELDYEELREIVSNATDLEKIVLEGKIKKIDFAMEANLQLLSLYDENFDLSLITPEIAKKHEVIECKIGSQQIKTERYESEYIVIMSSECIIQQYEKLKDLIKNAREVKVLDGIIRVKNTTDLNWILENKNIFKEFKNIAIEVPHIGIIDSSQLKNLDTNRIIVRDEENDVMPDRYTYTQEEYKTLNKKIKGVIEKVPKDISELQKFMMIYRKIALYDYMLIDKEHSYEDILYNCLNAAGIECCKVGGEGNVWNKVNIEGKWYNVDLTNDSRSIQNKETKDLDTCLRSDEEFAKRYKQEDERKIRCQDDYPREVIEETIEKIQIIEYNNREEKKSVWQRIKSFWNRMTNTTKKIEPPKMTEEKSTLEKRNTWIEKEELKADNGTEISRVQQSEIKLTRDVVDKEVDG